MAHVATENLVRLGRVSRTSIWGRIALRVKEKSGIRIISFADPIDVERFQEGDMVKFEYNQNGQATHVRKTSAKDPVDSSWKERS